MLLILYHLYMLTSKNTIELDVDSILSPSGCGVSIARIFFSSR